MYSIVVRQLYSLQSDSPNNSSTHLALCIPYHYHWYHDIINDIITISLTTFLILYFTSSWLFCNCQFVYLNPFTFFTQCPNLPPLWQPSVCSLYPWVCFRFVCSFILFFRFHIEVKSHGICVSLSDLLHLAQYPLGLPMLSHMTYLCTFNSIPWEL